MEMNNVKFVCNKNLSECVDSMLFDSYTNIASLEFEADDHKVGIYLDVRGEVKVDYKGERYVYPSC